MHVTHDTKLGKPHKEFRDDKNQVLNITNEVTQAQIG